MEEKKLFSINAIDVIRLLRNNIKSIAWYAVVCGVVGVLLAFATPKIWKSSVVLAPEESGTGFSGSISSLASMVGMNMKLGQSGDALYPEIYPDLMSSTDFIVQLFDVKITKDKTGEQYTYYEYISKHQKFAFYQYPMILLQESIKRLSDGDNAVAAKQKGDKHQLLRLTRTQNDVLKFIQNNVECSVDKKTDVITITVTDQDPLIAATMADSIKQHLQVAITEYRTCKAKNDMEYMQRLCHEARVNYDKARQLYASYADANQELELQAFRLKQDDLENDMQLKYNIYNTLAEQLQLAKAKVQERTPAFTVIQSANVPVKHSSRPKLVTLIMWMMLGFIIRCTMLTWKNRNLFINI